MSNQPFHNKWHGFNHHTVPTVGFPDSATDPIASKEFPYLGFFYNDIPSDVEKAITSVTITTPGSGYTTAPTVVVIPAENASITDPPLFGVDFNRNTKILTGVSILNGGGFTGNVTLSVVAGNGNTIQSEGKLSFTTKPYSRYSNSSLWEHCYTFTQTYSSDWWLYPSVSTTTRTLSTEWNKGFTGYTVLLANSGIYYDNVYTNTISWSSSLKYTGTGETGWHIALSAATHRLNVNSVNIKQKVAIPVRLYANDNNTITWITTAQTVYINLTDNITLTAKDIFAAKKGGKYTMWIYVDKCPQSFANLFFAKNVYNIVSKDSTGGFIYKDNVVDLLADSITRIDFVYDGVKMLGRATYFKTTALTTDDVYYRGVGLKFNSPQQRPLSYAYVNSNYPVDFNDRYFNPILSPKEQDPGDSLYIGNIPTSQDRFTTKDSKITTSIILSTLNIDTTSTPSSSLYIAGDKSIRMRFLDGNQFYFTFLLNNPSWTTLGFYDNPDSDARVYSFDRIVGNNPNVGDWTEMQYAKNLLVTPEASLDSYMKPFNSQPGNLYPEGNILWSDRFPAVSGYELGSEKVVSFTKCFSEFRIDIFSGPDREIVDVLINENSVSKQPVYVEGVPQPFTFNNEEVCTYTFYRLQEDYFIEVFYNIAYPRTIPDIMFDFNTFKNFTFNNNTKVTTIPDSVRLDFLSGNVYSATVLSNDNTNNRPNIVKSKNIRYINFTGNASLYTPLLNSNLLETYSTDEETLSAFSSFTSFITLSTSGDVNSKTSIWWLGDIDNTLTNKSGLGVILSGGQLYDPYYKEFYFKVSPNTLYNISVRWDNRPVADSSLFRNSTYTIWVNGRAYVRRRSINVDKNFENINFKLNHITGGSYKFISFLMYEKVFSTTDMLRMHNYIAGRYNFYK